MLEDAQVAVCEWFAKAKTEPEAILGRYVIPPLPSAPWAIIFMKAFKCPPFDRPFSRLC
jgi:hypothetical protein